MLSCLRPPQDPAVCRLLPPSPVHPTQVGAQEVALGIKFSANCVLQCVEHLRGVPEALLSPDCSQQDSFPRPLPAEGASGTRDIAFTMLEGDFQVGARADNRPDGVTTQAVP